MYQDKPFLVVEEKGQVSHLVVESVRKMQSETLNERLTVVELKDEVSGKRMVINDYQDEFRLSQDHHKIEGLQGVEDFIEKVEVEKGKNDDGEKEIEEVMVWKPLINHDLVLFLRNVVDRAYGSNEEDFDSSEDFDLGDFEEEGWQDFYGQ